MFPGSTNSFVMYDRGTDWTECAPQMSLSYEQTKAAMRHFQGTSGRKVKSFYADNFPSITKAARAMGWCNPHSCPGVPQTNGLAERMVRRVKEGGRANLIQSGLPYSWWPYAVTHFCAARNIQCRGGDSPYNRRHGTGHCRAYQVPFGALIYFAPTPRTGAPGRPPFKGKNVLGLFLGYEFHPGGHWAGSYRVLDWEQMRGYPQLKPRRSVIQYVDTSSPRR